MSASSQDAQVEVLCDRTLPKGTARYYTADAPEARQFTRRGAVLAYVHRRARAEAER